MVSHSELYGNGTQPQHDRLGQHGDLAEEERDMGIFGQCMPSHSNDKDETRKTQEWSTDHPCHPPRPLKTPSTTSSKEAQASRSDSSLRIDVSSNSYEPRREYAPDTKPKDDLAFFDLRCPDGERVRGVHTYPSQVTMSSSGTRQSPVTPGALIRLTPSVSYGSNPSGATKEQLPIGFRDRYKVRGRQIVKKITKPEGAAIIICAILSLMIVGGLIALLYTHGKRHKKYAHSAVIGATFALMITVGTAVTIWRKNMGEVLLTVMWVDVTGFLALQQLDTLLS